MNYPFWDDGTRRCRNTWYSFWDSHSHAHLTSSFIRAIITHLVDCGSWQTLRLTHMQSAPDTWLPKSVGTLSRIINSLRVRCFQSGARYVLYMGPPLYSDTRGVGGDWLRCVVRDSSRGEVTQWTRSWCVISGPHKKRKLSPDLLDLWYPSVHKLGR